MAVKTLDIYCGAYILTKGGVLDHIELSTNGRKGKPTVTFVFTGEGVEELSREFQSGRAMANVSFLRGSLDHLKDLMFARLREKENEKERDRHDSRKAERKVP